MLPWLQESLGHVSLHDDRLGQSLDGLVAANLHDVCGAIVRDALEVYATPTPRPLAKGCPALPPPSCWRRGIDQRPLAPGTARGP
jgi:hypothetical protein